MDLMKFILQVVNSFKEKSRKHQISTNQWY